MTANAPARDSPPTGFVRLVRGSLLALVGLFSSSCGASEATPPAWIDLSVGFVPEHGATARPWTDATGALIPATMDEAGEGIWLERALPAESWTARSGGRWHRMRPDPMIPRTAQNAVLELVGPAGAVKRVSSTTQRAHPDGVVFWVSARNELTYRNPRSTSPPAEMRWREHVRRGGSVDGRRRVVVGRVTGFGLDVWPGEEARRTATLTAPSALRFVTVADGTNADGVADFRVQVDGVEVFRHEQRVADRPQFHSIELPKAPGEVALLFTVDGSAATAAFLDPQIGPRDVGTYAARPWADQRPNLVLFSADTLRADGLAAFGGSGAHAPNLDRIAAASVRFRNARSPSSWTLPAHASMWTGLYPGQHGADASHRVLAAEAVTLAEHFASRGYRTGAITDGVFVSSSYGLDQGFAWFEEHDDWDAKERPDTPNLVRTLRGATDFLGRDDGRPVLLFVHTYRVHNPYRTGVEEDRSLYSQIVSAAGKELRASERTMDVANGSELLGDLVDRFRDLYYQGVTDLDTAIGPFWEDVLVTGALDHGAFCFVSDHGEAFYEHGVRQHHNRPHEEQVRIPLFVYAPFLEQRDVDWGVTLVDVPKTLAEIAEVPPAPEWGGRSLLGVNADEPLFLSRERDWAILDGARKIFFSLEDPTRVTEAYDLSSDPGEAHDVARTASWPEEMALRFAGEVERLRERTLSAGELELSDEMRDRLDELGYAGD